MAKEALPLPQAVEYIINVVKTAINLLALWDGLKKMQGKGYIELQINFKRHFKLLYAHRY